MARQAIHEKPMTPAQRKARSRQLFTSSIHAEATLAAELITDVRDKLALAFSTSNESNKLLEALDALHRLQHIIEGKQ